MPRDGAPRLLRGVDHGKDQSYVLFGAPQDRLGEMMLPIGGYEKAVVREMAEDFGLPVFDKPDSQEICFVPDNDYAGLVERRRPDLAASGPILTREGDMLIRPPTGSAPAFQLMMLGQSMVPMLQRFYLVVAILVQHGSGTLSRVRLEKMCQSSAERLSMIYGLHSPDFFNKTLFHDFIKTLHDQDVLRRNAEGAIEFDDDVTSIGADARLVLGEEIRHSILSLTFTGDNGETA